ncbi:transcription termination factor MTERF6, chloroplastic/mitochondrial-like [Syzygium oleosum]|uniref:transcription termination factor MTERF6, chloroplastic/mitochondrial-like n=1 Tax=Syzygium oleosum TaxID=219896 RepID=UPI0011D295F7|nr:transcription termination factor MTERF6, chloroplastic/mitochondrial-like [Syzygium oleosum]
MFHFSRKALLHVSVLQVPPQADYLRLLLRFSSTSSKSQSFTVSYLVNSCGLSPESALCASKLVKFETPSRPDAVIGVFKDRGFAPAQISHILRRFPALLSADPDKTLLPKIDFLCSRGISDLGLAKLVVAVPKILSRSLEQHLVPTFHYISNLLQSDERAIAAITRAPRMLYEDPQAELVPEITTLRSAGVPEANIRHLVLYHGQIFWCRSWRFDATMNRVKAMGFDPAKLSFVTALHVIMSMSESMWRRKIGVYGRWGWSEEEVLLAFRKYPLCMALSESKITAAMDFFVNVVGLDSSVISQRPLAITFSLGKRIVPRGSVFQVLLSKGVIKPCSLTTLLTVSEKKFLEKFVTTYLGEAPQLLAVYNEKMGLAC